MAVKVAEWFADGAASSHMLLSVEKEVRELLEEICTNAADHFDTNAVWRAALAATSAVGCRPVGDASTAASCSAAATASQAAKLVQGPDYLRAVQVENAIQAGLFRDIFGNPLRPVSLRPEWRTPNVVAIALSAYNERTIPSGELDLAPLGVLSDALEEAGCNHADILTHLRSPGPHVRGCWVVDLILGKE
jgi:hypothetical protein